MLLNTKASQKAQGAPLALRNSILIAMAAVGPILRRKYGGDIANSNPLPDPEEMCEDHAVEHNERITLVYHSKDSLVAPYCRDIELTEKHLLGPDGQMIRGIFSADSLGSYDVFFRTNHVCRGRVIYLPSKILVECIIKEFSSQIRASALGPLLGILAQGSTEEAQTSMEAVDGPKLAHEMHRHMIPGLCVGSDYLVEEQRILEHLLSGRTLSDARVLDEDAEWLGDYGVAHISESPEGRTKGKKGFTLTGLKGFPLYLVDYFGDPYPQGTPAEKTKPAPAPPRTVPEPEVVTTGCEETKAPCGGDVQHEKKPTPKPLSVDDVLNLGPGLFRLFRVSGGFDIVFINYDEKNPIKDGKPTERSASIFGHRPSITYRMNSGESCVFPADEYFRAEKAATHAIQYTPIERA